MPGVPSLYILIAGVTMFVLLLLYALRNYVYDAVMFLRERWKFLVVMLVFLAIVLVIVFLVLNYKPPPVVLKPGIRPSVITYS